MKFDIEKFEKYIRSECVDGIYDGSIDLSNKNLRKLPNLSDISITGHYDCSNNHLTSLDGSPKWVESYFNCSNNDLTDLKSTTKIVGDYLNCAGNPHAFLDHAPKCLRGKIYWK